MKHVFASPYVFEDETYEEIEFDLESLKGSDIAKAKKRFTSEGNHAFMPTVDSEFCAHVLAILMKKPIEFFSEMPAREYCLITTKVSNFFHNADSK